MLTQSAHIHTLHIALIAPTVARVEAWVRKFAEALSTPNQMQKIRNTVRMNAMRSSAGRALLARSPIPELDAVGVGGVGVGVGVGVTGVVLSASGGGGGGGGVDVTHAGMALVSDEMLGVQKRKRGACSRSLLPSGESVRCGVVQVCA